MKKANEKRRGPYCSFTPQKVVLKGRWTDINTKYNCVKNILRKCCLVLLIREIDIERGHVFIKSGRNSREEFHTQGQ